MRRFELAAFFSLLGACNSVSGADVEPAPACTGSQNEYGVCVTADSPCPGSSSAGTTWAAGTEAESETCGGPAFLCCLLVAAPNCPPTGSNATSAECEADGPACAAGGVSVGADSCAPGAMCCLYGPAIGPFDAGSD